MGIESAFKGLSCVLRAVAANSGTPTQKKRDSALHDGLGIISPTSGYRASEGVMTQTKTRSCWNVVV
jgi:hypothetical protein